MCLFLPLSAEFRDKNGIFRIETLRNVLFFLDIPQSFIIVMIMILGQIKTKMK